MVGSLVEGERRGVDVAVPYTYVLCFCKYEDSQNLINGRGGYNYNIYVYIYEIIKDYENKLIKL